MKYLAIALLMGIPGMVGAQGYVELSASPEARVALDGEVIGRTPVKTRRVSSGRHAVTLTNDDLGTVYRFEITVQNGKTVSCSYDFSTAIGSCKAEGKK